MSQCLAVRYPTEPHFGKAFL